MRHYLFLLCWLFPAVLHAQDTSSFPRWYGSLQYGRQNYQLFRPNNPEPWRTNQRRPQLALGYQFTPRWAVQAGWGPARYSGTNSAIGTNELGQPLTENSWGEDRSNVFSVSGRYTLPREVLKHLQFEIVGGPIVLTDHNWGETTHTENGQVTLYHKSDIRSVNVYALLGAGAVYSFGRHFQATADLTFNKNFKRTLDAYNVYTTGNRAGISRSVSLGVRYRFLYR
ncbi:outer membrane beta-barrel protein [Hymenobacter sp. 102]|uniref:outer membrane beta-barrel protein n=1 Tax=Hymenobacter sp. 102 TaxID=3403152 RepID=UPI003CFA31A4